MEKIEWNGEYYANFFEAEGEGPGGQKLRSWDDARKYGFLSAGGARCYWHPLLMLSPGDRVWVKMKHKDGTKGFVGCCIVNASAVPAASVKISGTPFFSLPLSAEYCRSRDDEDGEYVVLVEWIKAVPANETISQTGMYGNQQTVCRPRQANWPDTIEHLKNCWEIE